MPPARALYFRPGRCDDPAIELDKEEELWHYHLP